MANSKITDYTSKTGATVTASTDLLEIVDFGVLTNKKITVDELLIAMLASTTNARFKVGNLTRVLNVATGDVAYVGVGFKPKAIIFLSGIATVNTMGSIGFDDGTNKACYLNDFLDSASGWVLSTSVSIYVVDGAGTGANAFVKTFDTDGFTLTWTRVGASGGTTATVGYLAIK